ncbi:MAG: putative DNA binding domain-containing protein [Candidatus Methanoplasma sp.]|jgi:hypothetical protein|nr:putative DNA binding domain-containing protein [Candidatus Methanoplasma sp.]
MLTDDPAPADTGRNSMGEYVSGPLYASYAIMLFFSAVILLAGIYFGNFLEVFIAIPVILILADALLTERTLVHIPPFMIFMAVGLMVLIVLGRFFGESYPVVATANFLFGVVMGLGGLIISYSLMPVPDLDKKKPLTMIFVSISVALSLFTVLSMIQYYLGLLFDSASASSHPVIWTKILLAGLDEPGQTIGGVMDQLVFVILGALSVSVAFYLSRNSPPVRRAVKKYLEDTAATLDVDEYESIEIRKALANGESEKVEYKSTLRTSLSSGEKEDKIERSVLKTLVAFMNSRGGTLLIGVADDGAVVGIDESSFESRDKLNLHLTNIMAAHIGNEYLPYITFRLSDYQGKGVMRVVCRKSDTPVFLKEGREETFFVRSGPSSVELHGMDTLNYVENRFKKRRRKIV